MGRSRFKWKCIFISYLVLLNVFTKSLPIQEVKLSTITTTDTVFTNSDLPLITDIVTDALEELTTTENANIVEGKNETHVDAAVNFTLSSLLRQVRPGQEIRQYAVELTDEGDGFSGRVVLDVVLSQGTRDDPIVLYSQGLNINSVKVGVFTDANSVEVDFDLDEPILEIFPETPASSYIVDITYDAPYSISGRGFHKGIFNGGDGSYLSMNLHPIYARHVFPCMDEPTEVSIISFTYNNIDYTHLFSNSLLEENSQNQFRALQGPPHVWGMVAHNFININIPVSQVLLFGRPGVVNQDAQASVAINSYYNNLAEWTNKPYFEILLNQNNNLNIIALPDVSTDWHALSVIGIWEPHIFMETVHSIKQRKESLFQIALALSKQWFGYVIFPENWRYEWLVSGLATYAAYEMMREFQNDHLGTDVTLLDVHTLFVTDVIQESLLHDGYAGSQILEPDSDIFDEEDIRNHMTGVMKYKAPAILRMMRVVLGDSDTDYIQNAARILLTGRSLQTVNTLDFVDALNSQWGPDGNDNIDDLEEYLESWMTTTGYPLLHVSLRQGGVLLMIERFGSGTQSSGDYSIPITYTTSIQADFSDFHPVMMTDGTATLNFVLDDDDWVLFNIQGQGYYRVNYDGDLWDRIIEALEEPERREEIHPLNRATLVDDALNLARSDKLNYDFAFRVVLAMEHETEYAPWKAFIRNMEYLRLRLIAMVDDDEDLDPDIYLRMVRRTIGAVEDKLGFSPDVSLTEPVMDSLTRGLIMDHACRANYEPCIAAAVDWFYDPNSNDPVVNPNIPHDIRPAVFCTMVREGDDDVIEALHARLDIEPTMYERVVILESLGCSQDEDFIRSLLDETIAEDGPYSVEERSKIFAAVVRGSFQNAGLALNFIARRSSEVMQMYGQERMEELIFVLADHMVDDDLVRDFTVWVESQNNNLDDSQIIADRALALVNENQRWSSNFLEDVYEWIDENDASTTVLSLVALCVSVALALINH